MARLFSRPITAVKLGLHLLFLSDHSPPFWYCNRLASEARTYLALQVGHLYKYIILDTKSLGMRTLKRNKCGKPYYGF